MSGDEAAANPDVRALAERATKVLAISMFRSPLSGWADLVLPGTSYLERDGTYMNLEGRLQRLRRAVIAPCPDELAWIAKLAERFGVAVSPHGPLVFAELSERCYGGIDYTAIGQRASLPTGTEVDVPTAPTPAKRRAKGTGCDHLPAALLGPSRRARSAAPVPATARRSSSRPRTQRGSASSQAAP